MVVLPQGLLKQCSVQLLIQKVGDGQMLWCLEVGQVRLLPFVTIITTWEFSTNGPCCRSIIFVIIQTSL